MCFEVVEAMVESFVEKARKVPVPEPANSPTFSETCPAHPSSVTELRNEPSTQRRAGEGRKGPP
ncbi:hypothetical protein RHCRD62_10921 [Rhodococcus sp. RD6.2]|nr:hypothetical protein RHCRD62_10921 [Rhodococcus sp. RD6.2]